MSEGDHRLVLLRHGETEWAAAGRHTGRTDVPLTERGEQQARSLASFVSALGPVPAFTSPLQRARRTAELAGLSHLTADDDLLEWDYGGYEGLTSAQIRERTGHPWELFADGVVPGDTPGETLPQVAARTARILDRLRPLLTHSDVVLVAHGHLLRVLTTVWLRSEPTFGAQLVLDPATISTLGELHGVPAIRMWNAVHPT